MAKTVADDIIATIRNITPTTANIFPITSRPDVSPLLLYTKIDAQINHKINVRICIFSTSPHFYTPQTSIA